MLAWAAMLLMTASQFAVGTVQSPDGGANAGEPCELHVWSAGYPNRKLPKRLLKSIPPEHLDPNNPYSGISLFGVKSRARQLPDETIGSLFGEDVAVTIIRHPETIDQAISKVTKAKAPLSDSNAECQADLVLKNVVGIFPNPSAAYETAGLVGTLLAGSDRLVMDFFYQEFRPGKKRFRVRKNDDTPLPHVPNHSPQMKQALELSADENIKRFVSFVQSKRKK